MPRRHGCLAQKTLIPFDIPERIHCKSGTRSAGLVFDTRAKCQDFIARFFKDGLQYSFDSLFVIPRAQVLYVNQNHQNGARLVDALLHCAKFGLVSYKKFSLKMKAMVHAWSQPTTSVHKSSTCLIEDLGLEYQCSGLPRLGVIICLVFLLMCLYQRCQLTCCNKFLVKQVLRPRGSRPMCDGRSLASSPFRRMASRGLLFLCGATLMWPLQVALYNCIHGVHMDHKVQYTNTGQY